MDELSAHSADFIARLMWWAAIFAILTPLEFAFPRGRRQPIAQRLQGLVFWVVWVAASSAWFALYGALWRAIGVRPLAHLDLERLSAWAGPASAIMSVFLSTAIADLFFYWFHRAQHAWPWLWRLHAVHHSIREMNAVTSYHHVSDAIFRTAFITLPLSLLAIHAADVPLLSSLVALQAIAIHCPTTLHAGPLRCLLVDNRFHRIHHSLEPRHFNKNFTASVTIWDQVFGTAYFPAPDEWPDAGLAEVPEPSSIKDWITLPLRL